MSSFSTLFVKFRSEAFVAFNRGQVVSVVTCAVCKAAIPANVRPVTTAAPPTATPTCVYSDVPARAVAMEVLVAAAAPVVVAAAVMALAVDPTAD